MYPCINKNARPNDDQFINYYQRVSYLLRIQEYPVNNTYNSTLTHLMNTKLLLTDHLAKV